MRQKIILAKLVVHAPYANTLGSAGDAERAVLAAKEAVQKTAGVTLVDFSTTYTSVENGK